MAAVSAFSSPTFLNSNPNPSSNHHSQIEEAHSPNLTGDGDGDKPSMLPPIRTNPDQQQVSHNHDGGDDNDIHDVTQPHRDSDPVHDQTLIPNPTPKTPNYHGRASPPKLFHVSFNQNYGCFACGINNGFRIYNCDPFRQIFRKDFEEGGGIGIVGMLFRCNLLALVGGGPEPQYPLNKVMIWDDQYDGCIGELSFRSEVRGVRLRRDRIVVVLEKKIYVYNFADLKLLHQIETFVNPKGLCEVSQGSGNFMLVCPGLQKGQLRVEHCPSKRSKFIPAHASRIACFTLTQDGNMVATASSKGTLVRIFNTHNGTLLQEVRRGADRAEIYSLAFSSTAQWLAVSSDKGTVHVFSLKANQETDKSDDTLDHNTPVSPSSLSLSFIKGVLPRYFSSEWSVAQFRLAEGSCNIVAFGHEKNTVVILGLDGSFYRCKFDPKTGGEMTQLEYHNFVKPDDSF